MVDFRKMVLLPLLIWFIQKSTITSASIIPDDFSSISTLFQSRMKRDNDYKVKCHQSGTGKVIFLEHIHISIPKSYFLFSRLIFVFCCTNPFRRHHHRLHEHDRRYGGRHGHRYGGRRRRLQHEHEYEHQHEYQWAETETKK